MSQPTLEIVYDTPGDYPVYAQFNRKTKQMYKVLYDKVHRVSNTGMEVSFRKVYITKMLKNLQLVSPTNIYHNVIKGEIFCLISSDSSAVSHPEFVWQYRLNYTDA